MSVTHAEILAMHNNGDVSIGVDRKLAPHFYTRFLSREFSAVADGAAAFEGFVVWLGMLLGHVALIASVVLSFFAVGWLGIFALMACPLLFGMYVSASVVRGAGLGGITVLLGIAIATYFWGNFANHFATLFVVVFLTSLWSIRFAYCAASFLLHCLVIRNERAFNFLLERSVIHLRFREP